MSVFLTSAPARAQRVAPAGNQNLYWVLEAADGTDQAISFWGQGRATATVTPYSWTFGSAAPTWHYAVLPNPNPTANALTPPATIDDNRGSVYLSQRGSTLTPQAGNSYYTSAMYMSDIPVGASAGSARLLANVKGQPEMLLIPTLTGSGLPSSPNISLFCGGAYALYYEATSGSTTTGTGNLHARFIKPSSNPPTTDGIDNTVAFKALNTCGSNTYTQTALPGSGGAFSVTIPHVYAPANQRRQVVYVAVGQEDHVTTTTNQEGIYALVLTDDQQSVNGVLTALPLRPLLDPCECTPPIGRALTLTESRLIGGTGTPGSSACMGRTAIAGATKATFTTSEIEVTADRKRLAWAGKDGKVYVAALFPSNGALDLSISPNVVAVADFSATGLNATNARVNGLEFAPDGSYNLYVTVGTDAGSAGSIDGFYKIASTSTTGITYTAPSRRANPGLGVNTQYVAQSQIEADRNGLLRLLGVASVAGRPSSLIAFDPAAGSGAGAFLSPSINSPAVTAKLALTLKNTATDIRRLPRQVDGSDYGFAGHIYGPAYVQTLAYPASCSTPAPYPLPVPAPTATFAIDALSQIWNPTYQWSVSPAIAGFSSSGTTTQTITFPASTASYVVICNIGGTTDCASGVTYTSEFSVATGDGCPVLPQRPAPTPPPVVAAWPVPGDAYLELTRSTDDPATVELLDGQGQVRLMRAWPERVLTLSTATLPEGLYVLRVRQAGQPPVTRRISIAHR